MKITCSKNHLSNALSIISKGIPSKPSTPILSGLYMRAEGNTLELHTRNNEVGFIDKIPADIEEAGEIVVSGRYFQEVIRSLPGDNVTITFDRNERTVHINSNQAHFTLLSMNAAEYPTVKHIDGQLKFTIKHNVLCELIKKTVFACAKDNDRPTFTGCSFSTEGNKLTLAATNSHRLAVYYEIFNEELTPAHVIIPAPVLNELLHDLSAEIPTDVQIVCDMQQISFSYENLYICSRLISGTFPDFTRLLNISTKTHAKVNVQELRGAVDRMSLMMQGEKINTIKFEFAQNTITLSAYNPQLGNAEETIPAEIEGPDILIAFNGAYLSDVMKAMTTTECLIDLATPLTAISIREVGNEQFQYIVTPVRTAH